MFYILNCQVPQAAQSCHAVSLGAGERKGGEEEISLHLVVQPLWPKVFSCEGERIVHHLGVIFLSPCPLVPLQVLTVNIHVRYQNPLPWCRKGFKIHTAAVLMSWIPRLDILAVLSLEPAPRL